MKYIFGITLLMFISNVGSGQDYNASLIPENLRENANVVIRNSDTRIDIKNEGRATIRKKYSFTILNSAGDDHASTVLFYDKLISINNFEGTLYDASGKKIKSLKKADIKDYSATESSNLADDSRYRLHNFNYKIYPYTIEYKTEVELNGIFYFPSWTPVEDECIAIEESNLFVEYPVDYKIRYKVFNIKTEPEIVSEKESKTMHWKLNNIAAFTHDMYSAPWHEITPGVFLAPSTFKLQEYHGNMSDWQGMAAFMYKLNSGRDKLTDNIKQKVRDLISGISDPNHKIKVLYEFLQNNTRYISIQLGIGGWQTFDAASVISNGYGDCKALSNYMIALLKEAGIKSYAAIIKAGKNKHSFIEDFPSNQFNHVIVCIPGPKDTMWLECTSKTEVPGYLGSFTSNRNALIIDETGGKLVRTPVYNKKDNLQARNINATLSADGNMTVAINTLYKGEQQDDVHGLLNALSKESIKEHLNDMLSIPSYDLIKYSYAQNRSGIPSIQEELQVTAYNFATITGKRIFITPNILNRSTIRLTDQKKRTQPLKLQTEYTDIDTVNIIVPVGYTAESIPENTSLNTKFGSYSTKFEYVPGKILYIRNITRNSGDFPAADGISLAEFYDSIHKSDRARIVLVKND